MARHAEKKKVRKGRVFVSILLLLLVIAVVLGGIGFFQYQASLKKAEKASQMKSFEFNGAKQDGNSVNILFIGSDSRGADQGRSDSLMIAHYNKKTKQPKLVSLMRDTYVDIPGHGKNKINAAYSYGGPDLVRKTVKENFGIDCQYYVVTNFESFAKIIDTLAPNGIEIDAEKDMSENIDVAIKAGKQKMNGHTLLQYARFRHDAEGDFGRVRRQQQVLTAVKEQAVTATSVFKFPSVLGTVQGYTSTDLPTSLVLKTGMDFVLGRTDELKTLTVPVKDTWENQRIAGAGAVLRVDISANRKAVEAFLKD
ncbi:putative transcriptional regulator, LytR family protein [Listeria floridensis FSL S10-1187]|uniref:Regulatory protein MsrR n=1 Tax=Listeria floridensis FSL S10-1187 TaxID=1265817 RepID=A0ABN0RGZ9_9LIST|nr:LCP family protein [Listeria floridensis]EUJ33201.1 putative transcriptional regulator, LytR family protein [Listeria floridensis FSL S10-1187]